MAKRFNQLTQLTAAQLAQNDIIPIRDESAGQTKYITVKDLTGSPDAGWSATGEAWTFSSWNSTYKIGIVTVPSDATTKYTPGMRVRFSQVTGGVKFGIIHAVTSTTLTIFFGTDYTLTNETLTSPVYTGLKVPVGFNVDPNKWKVEVSSSSLFDQAAPTQNVWYNHLTINLPVGIWDLQWQASFGGWRAGSTAAEFKATLSTGTTTESDTDMTASVTQESGSGTTGPRPPGQRRKFLALTSNTPYYLNVANTQVSANAAQFLGTLSKTIIRAVDAYL